MTKIIISVALAAMLILYISSCGKKVEEDSRGDAKGLYKRTCSLTQAYIDSISVAKDTLELNDLLDRYEERVDALNMEVESETDFKLTEGENDTIIQLLERLSHVRRERLRALGATLPADSAALHIADSLR